MTEREKFEEWWDKTYPYAKRPSILVFDVWNGAWQAAKAQDAAEIEELRKRVGELGQSHNEWMTVVTDCRMCAHWKGKFCGSAARCIDANLFNYPKTVMPIQAWEKSKSRQDV